MLNINYTDKQFWDSYFLKHEHKPEVIKNSLFSDIFDKYLEPNPNNTVLEVGCADSNFLCYISKKLEYKAFGVDYSDAISTTVDLFELNNLPEPKLYKEDFFSWQPDKKFDLVCSFGFIEHFKDINQVITRHADLVAPKGKLIITLPHFSGLQYVFHWLIDRENLKKHNTKIMNLRSIKKAILSSGLEIEHLSYYKTFGFWTENHNMGHVEKVINWTILKLGKIINKVLGYNIPNPLFSPHIVCVAKKIN